MGGGVGGEEPGSDGGVERRAQCRPDAGLGSSGDRAPFSLMLAGDRGEHRLYMLRAHVS